MKMPLATFEGSIRVGQEKAVIAKKITLTYGFVAAENAPVQINGRGNI
jgi:3-hydroxyacyl-[acyl-carrier-protein] dehydratase